MEGLEKWVKAQVICGDDLLVPDCVGVLGSTSRDSLDDCFLCIAEMMAEVIFFDGVQS